MGKFSLTRLVMCGKYERLSSADYMRLGLCLPEQCRDCQQGVGHYVKNDTMVSIIPANEVFATSYQLLHSNQQYAQGKTRDVKCYKHCDTCCGA